MKINMFKKLFHGKEEKKDRHMSEETAGRIPYYGPHDGMQPKDYLLSETFSKFEENFEAICRDWIEKAHPDEFNRSFMDLLIEKIEAEAYASIELQRLEHMSVIDELTKVQIGDREKAIAKLAELEEEKTVVDREIKRLERIYHKGTAYSEDYEVETGRFTNNDEIEEVA